MLLLKYYTAVWNSAEIQLKMKFADILHDTHIKRGFRLNKDLSNPMHHGPPHNLWRCELSTQNTEFVELT